MPPVEMTSAQVREKLVEALGLDLIGPECHDTAHTSEILSQTPSRWYLTGFLVPQGASPEQKSDYAASEEVDAQGDSGSGDDAATPEKGSERRGLFPSSVGLSTLIPKETKALRVVLSWGDYAAIREKVDPAAVVDPTLATISSWQRTHQEHTLDVPLPADRRLTEIPVPGVPDIFCAVLVKPIGEKAFIDGLLPKGAKSVSVFLVNRRSPQPDEVREQAFLFQASVAVFCEEAFVPRPNLRGQCPKHLKPRESGRWKSENRDEMIADLQYRDAFEYATGHCASARATLDPDGKCRRVQTRWIPTAEVERVAPSDIPGIELSMEKLAALSDGNAAQTALGALVGHYREWIVQQDQLIPGSPPQRREVGNDLLTQARVAANRIEIGIALLNDPLAMEAFRVANLSMAMAARQRRAMAEGKPPEEVAGPSWRPFQIAFLLMNLKGIVDPKDADREVVDLLFFPTGGGKTEAYLGLAAFTLVYRRLHNPGIASAGLCVLMRYTLRLLTLDQLSRAATLICALEKLRQADVEKLGDWPFEIGLWVGQAATPNRMGKKGDPDPNTAQKRTLAFKPNSNNPSPIPLEECPWCGAKFTHQSFNLVPNTEFPIDLRITCANRYCWFTRDNALPILAVDEPIYRRLPCFMIATVDKFAAMPWTGPVGKFFGRAQRFNKSGFFGPCEPNDGMPLPGSGTLLPPDLIIQDELHLISGPLGTMVGLYETALEGLCVRTVDGKKIVPKIVASTATVRRAENQIRALFGRKMVDIFPPPGPNRRDSFFARTHSPAESNARLYLGIAAQGRSLKVVLLRSYLALLSAAMKWYNLCGGKKNPNNPADPYMTLLGYFNSLRELGGSRRIVEDEVSSRLQSYGSRRRSGETEGDFVHRKIAYEVLELTSRVSTDKVAEARRRLSMPFTEKDAVDLALATNMISVGLDITRLGLMVVLGQPKTSAEYIQATSRVGREPQKPGLVLTLLNVHRPRDRSHYERFLFYHQTFYRSVEATSVTPFSPRALDRGLPGAVVALARQAHHELTAPLGAEAIRTQRGLLGFVVEALRERAEICEAGQQSRVRDRVEALLDAWARVAEEQHQIGGRLQYQTEEGSAKRLLYEPLNPELRTLPPNQRQFRANRSLRDVEPSVNIWVRTLDNQELEDE